MEFHFLQTDDGSPSLKLAADAEAMHSSKGAFAETVYIYGHAISTTLEKKLSPSFFSLGLGLGYNELLTAALLLKHKIDLTQVYGESFELVPELTENFLSWLEGNLVDDSFKNAYDQITNLCSAHVSVGTSEIKDALLTLYRIKNWKFDGPLNEATEFTQKFSCFLFDAFSSKTSPDLWNEEFITKFLETASAKNAILATYACTGSLKRALLKNQFDVEIRAGFAGKRESTFAVREASK